MSRRCSDGMNVKQPAAEPQKQAAVRETHRRRQVIMLKAVKRRQQYVAFADFCGRRSAAFLTCDSAKGWLQPLATCVCGSADRYGLNYLRQAADV
jgi:hypothetical protein